MINNKLTEDEFKKILLPIIRLDQIEKIKEAIYKVLHFTKALPTDKQQYRICPETTGINSTYKGFAIEIRGLNDIENYYIGVIIQFRKQKSFLDLFYSPKKRLVRDIQKLCDKEIYQARFKYFDSGGFVKDNITEEFFYQLGALNQNWKEQNKLSPLSIYTKEDFSSYLVEFLFTPNCYERKSDKTILRDNWDEIFSLYTPSW